MLSDILHLKKIEFLMAHRVRNVTVRNRAKFRGNWSKHDRDIAIFEFQDSSRPPSWIFKFQILTVGQLKKAELRRHAKFGRNLSKRGPGMALF